MSFSPPFSRSPSPDLELEGNYRPEPRGSKRVQCLCEIHNGKLVAERTERHCRQQRRLVSEHARNESRREATSRTGLENVVETFEYC